MEPVSAVVHPHEPDPGRNGIGSGPVPTAVLYPHQLRTHENGGRMPRREGVVSRKLRSFFVDAQLRDVRQNGQRRIGGSDDKHPVAE